MLILSGADLTNACFINVNFSDANLENTGRFIPVYFIRCNFSGAKNISDGMKGYLKERGNNQKVPD